MKCDNPDDRVVSCACQFLEEINKVRAVPGYENVRIRIGIHSGSVIGGVVGIKDPRYHLFGHVVDVAEGLESSGVAGEIHMSETTRKRLNIDLTKIHGSLQINQRYEPKQTLAAGELITTYLGNITHDCYEFRSVDGKLFKKFGAKMNVKPRKRIKSFISDDPKLLSISKRNNSSSIDLIHNPKLKLEKTESFLEGIDDISIPILTPTDSKTKLKS